MKTRPFPKSETVARLVLALSAISILTAGARAEAPGNWPNWRGPNGTGSIETGKYPTRWEASKAHWKVALPGKGTSTPIVLNGRIYLTAPADTQDAVLAFDFSGKPLWQTKLGPQAPPKHRQLGSSCNASPVTDGQTLFVYFKSGNFAALELDGTVRWKMNLVERFGRDQLFWDQGTSPIVTDQHVIMTRMHGGDSWIAGFDKTSGAMKWQQARNYQAPTENDNGYSTPLLFAHEGKPALLVWGADHLTAHDAADGKPLWSCGGFNPKSNGFWPPIASPVIAGNVAVVPVGRDDRKQARVHGIQLGGNGEVSDTHRVWKREDVGVFVASPTEYQGRVYLLRHRGEVVCINPVDGQTIWSDAFPKGSANYFSSPVIANGILYAAREDGVIFTARVDGQFQLLSENPMGEQVIASPVPVANRLLIRTSEHLFCVTDSLE